MSIFQYKNYSTEKSIELLNTSQLLASYSATYYAADSVKAKIKQFFNPSAQLPSLPAGWRELSYTELKLPASAVDKQGQYIITSPITHNTLGGPQAKILASFNEQNQPTKLAVSFAGTNSIVDIPDYFQLNSGKIAPHFAPLLQAVKDYALEHHLQASDILITGYSLGGGYTNVMARYRESLVEGFFYDSEYIAHASPFIFDDGTVFNFGYENDIVFRILGDYDNLGEALKYNKLALNNPDMDYASTTNNIILYNAAYANYVWAYPLFSLVNPFAWSAHVNGLSTDAIMRVAESPFYQFMQADSTIVVSNLAQAGRKLYWVTYNNTFVDKHDDNISFIIGSQYDDKLKGGYKASYISAGEGNDAIKIGQGNDRVDGGEGKDTLWLSGRSKGWQAFRLSDDTLFFHNQNDDQLIQAENIEQITFNGELLSWSRPYQVAEEGLIDQRFRLFKSANKSLNYQPHIEGTDGDDMLSGQYVFTKDGNDMIHSYVDNALLHGGEGQDFLHSEGINAYLYGAEGDDILYAQGTGSVLSGGIGDDIFIFDRVGRYVITDFNLTEKEQDLLFFSRDLFDQQDWQQYSYQQRNDVNIKYKDFHLTIQDTQLNEILASEILVV